MRIDGDYAFVLVVLGTLVATGLMILATSAGRPALPRRVLRPWAAPVLRGRADLLQIDPTVWSALLVAGPVAGAAFGVLAHLPPALVVVVTLLGAVLVPWFSAFRCDSVVMRREEAVVALAKDLRDRLAGGALNQVVRNLGQRPPAALRASMAILADIDRPLEECLSDCSRRTGSTLMNRLCVYIAVGLKADATAFRELLPTTIVPHLEGLLRQQRARRRAIAYQRGVITMMGGVLVVLFGALYTLGPAFHDFYGTSAGAVTVACMAAGFGVLVGLVHLVLRTPRRPAWNLDALNNELAKY